MNRGLDDESEKEAIQSFCYLLDLIGELEYAEAVAELRRDDQMAAEFFALYRDRTERPTNVSAIDAGPFTYLYDSPAGVGQDARDRVVVAFGVSSVPPTFVQILDKLRKDHTRSGDQDGIELARITTFLLCSIFAVYYYLR